MNNAVIENHPVSIFPESSRLEKELSDLFSRSDSVNVLEISSRKPAVKSGTFAAEIITCRINGERSIDLRCKYLAGHENNQEGGHRGGVEYEAKIYESLFGQINLPLASFFGKFQIKEDKLFCMVSEFLDTSVCINQSALPDRMEKAADWIGSFHAAFEMKVPDFVINYDEKYYRHWVMNVQNIALELRPEYPWLNDVCNFFLEKLDYLTNGPKTLIHGEFYPNNILLKDGVVYPVDWESAAFAPGEIDLASLTEGYADEKMESMINRYLLSRWHVQEEYSYEDFAKRLLMARIYFHFRWLGRYPSLAVWKQKPLKYINFYKRMARLYQLRPYLR